MRIIDKLPFISPPQDRYTLFSSISIPSVRKKNQQVFSFAIDSPFYRGLGFDKSYKPFIKPFEKIFPEDTPIDELFQHFEEELKKYVNNNLLNPKVKIGTYIPTKYGLLKTYSFPRTLKKSEFLQSIELYIEQDISEHFSNTEVIYTYSILEGNKDEPYRVLVVIVERDFVLKIENLLHKFNLKADLISYEPICVVNLGLLKRLPQPFSILYTDINKILLVSFYKNHISYESFSFLFTGEKPNEDLLNLILWDIRNYIVLNNLNNIYLAGIVTEYEDITSIFLERLPIFGIITIDKFPNRFALTYTLGERLLNG